MNTGDDVTKVTKVTVIYLSETGNRLCEPQDLDLAFVSIPQRGEIHLGREVLGIQGSVGRGTIQLIMAGEEPIII